MTSHYTLYCYVPPKKRTRLSILEALTQNHGVDQHTAAAVVNNGKVLKFPSSEKKSLLEIAQQFSTLGFDTHLSEPTEP